MRARSPRLALLVVLALAAPAGAATLTSFAVEPRLPSTQDTLRFWIRGQGSPCFTGFAGPALDGHGIRIRATYVPLINCPPTAAFTTALTLPPLAAGTYQVLVEDGSAVLHTETLIVQPPATELALHHGSFLVRLQRHLGGPAGPDVPAAAVSLTDESGYFWFFDPANTEVTIKILDGSAVNGHVWIFVSSLTDVAFTLVVEDTDIRCNNPIAAPCPNTRTYAGIAGQNRNRIDLAAF